MATGEKIRDFGVTKEVGQEEDVYKHEIPSGLYIIVFKGSTNLEDESISSTVYLSEGDSLYVSYNVDTIEEKTIVITDICATINQ